MANDKPLIRRAVKTVEALDPRFHALVDSEASLRQVGTGFVFTEGPVWHPKRQDLLFSDIPASIRRRFDGTRITVQASPCNRGNGMTYDRNLDLLVCEQDTFLLARFREGGEGEREIVASHYDGKALNSPNDVVVARDGAIYFTDPTYGRLFFGEGRHPELDFQGVYRIPPDGGALELVVERGLFTQPNGLCFSPDERFLYVNDTEQANIRCFDVGPDGGLSNMRLFATGLVDAASPGVADGMKCDTQGNIWVTGPGGIWVFAAEGDLLGKIGVPEVAANLHWGAKDWRTLFITATSSLYAIDLKVGPHLEAFMAAGAGEADR